MNLFKETENILVVADLHAPYTKKGYFEFCMQQFKKYKCNKVVFIGDIADFASISYHEKSPEMMGPADELKEIRKDLSKWKKAFKNVPVFVTFGNHDSLIARKIQTAGLPIEICKSLGDILDVPEWNFDISFEFNDVIYTHGQGGGGIGGALAKVLNRRKSIVQGHFHTEAFVRWHVSDYDRLFACQVGSGVDDKSLAMAYAKFNTKKSIVSCAVVLDNGKLPIVIPMELS